MYWHWSPSIRFMEWFLATVHFRRGSRWTWVHPISTPTAWWGDVVFVKFAMGFQQMFNMECVVVFSQARCIAGQQGDVESSRWLVGTLSVREENEVGIPLTCVWLGGNIQTSKNHRSILNSHWFNHIKVHHWNYAYQTQGCSFNLFFYVLELQDLKGWTMSWINIEFLIS